MFFTIRVEQPAEHSHDIIMGEHSHDRYIFSRRLLRALVALVLVVSLGTMASHLRQRFLAQKTAVLHLQGVGAAIGYDWERQGSNIVYQARPGGSKWMRDCFGEAVPSRVVYIRWIGAYPNDKDIDALATLKELEVAILCTTRLTDRHVWALGQLQNLEVLDVRATGLSRNAVTKLQQLLPNCHIRSNFDADSAPAEASRSNN